MPMFRANVPLGQVGLDAHPVLEVPAQLVQEGYHQGIAGPETGHEFLPAGAPQGAAGGDVGKDQVLTDAVAGQQPELGFLIPGLVVGLADPGIAIGDGESGNGNQAASASHRSLGSVQKTSGFRRTAAAHGLHPPADQWSPTTWPATLESLANFFTMPEGTLRLAGA